jgi:hypothetical protein
VRGRGRGYQYQLVGEIGEKLLYFRNQLLQEDRFL